MDFKIQKYKWWIMAGIFALASIMFNTVAANAEETKVVVGIKMSEPFVFVDSKENPAGISIELWETMAEKNDWAYDYKVYDTVADLIEATEAGEIDVAVAPISITADREERVDLTHSYYQSGLGVLVTRNETSTFDLFLKMMPNFLKALAFLYGAMLVAGIIFWLIEHRNNGTVNSNFWSVFTGVYWASTTMTTVGYGDISPTTHGGRAFAMLWMWISMFFTSMFMGFIVSSTTVQAISDDSGNYTARVAVLSGSFGEQHSAMMGFNIVSYADLSQAITDLKEGKVTSVIHDKPILEYHANDSEDVRVNDLSLTNDNYGFAISNDDEFMMEQMNRSILKITSTGAWKTTIAKFK